MQDMIVCQDVASQKRGNRVTRWFVFACCLTAITSTLCADGPVQEMAPQAVSAVQISPDSKIITVGTMAFSHDANFWQFAPDGTVLNQRRLPPWAPMQVATLDQGALLAIGLAYSRVTSPDPTVWIGKPDELLKDPLKDEFALADSRDGEQSRWRTGAGAWRDGWTASQFGELFVNGPKWVFQPPTTFVKADGQRIKLRYEDGNLLPTSRSSRMAASRDGRKVAFGWLTVSDSKTQIAHSRDALSVWQVEPNRALWKAAPTTDLKAPELPNPTAEYPELGRDFRLKPDALVPGSLVTALAVNHDGSRVGLIEHAVWCWNRQQPAIGKWDPPIHVLMFVPRQPGRLRVFDGDGKELSSLMLMEPGQFEIGFGPSADELWCWPAAWFARGVNGCVWLPTDAPARKLLQVKIPSAEVKSIELSDTVAHANVHPQDGKLVVSTILGDLLLVTPDHFKPVGQLKSPARVCWSPDGQYAVAGTADGKLVRCNRDGTIVWTKEIPITPVPPLALPPSEEVPGIPIYQGGRISGGEHAYVGDIWVVRLRDEAVFVDCGGTSGTATTRERLRSLGIQRVTHILHTHSHGDHCGGAYLWQATGSRIVAPRSAELTQTWLMPMLSDYGIFPPRSVDDPLPLNKVGDECEFTAAGQTFRAVFVPGHSFDLTVYLTELNGKRIAFTGDLGFENQDILHRCWDDANKARAVLPVIRDKVLAWKPDLVFTGHGVRKNGTEFLTNLVEHTEKSLAERAK